MNYIPNMVDAYTACMTRGRSTRYPWCWDGIVGLWLPYVGIQGSRLFDWSGHHNHGTLTNMDPATDWVTSRYGYTLDFDGTNDYVDVPSAAGLDGSGTIFVRFMTRNAATTQEIYRDEVQAGNDELLHIRVTGGDINFRGYDNAAYQFTLTCGISSDTWYAVVGTFKANDARLYLNAQERASDTSVNMQAFPNHDYLDIGRHGRDNKDFFNGIIGQVAIWNRVLSAQEVALLYANPYALAEPAEEWEAYLTGLARRKVFGTLGDPTPLVGGLVT